MKFSTAWAKTAAQNVSLKIATVVLSLTAVAQLIVIVTLATKSLPVIDRGCFSRAFVSKPSQPTKDEIKAFLLEALPMRFDSTAYMKEGFLAIEESAARDKEQSTLKQRQIGQRLVISEIKTDGKEILAFADRLISVGKVKSALTLNLKIEVQQTNRTESNPYGLVLSSTTQVEEKEEK